MTTTAWSSTTPLPRNASAPGLPGAAGVSAGIGLAAVAVLALTLRGAVPTAVIGLVALGVLHNVFELRYLAGRFATVFDRLVVELLVVLASGIVLARLAALVAGRPAQYLEIVLSYAVLTVAAWLGTRGGRRVVALALLGLAAVASLAVPDFHFVVLTHLHNVVPLAFLWDVARRWRSGLPRALFRAANVAWVVVVPGVILSGALDRWLTADPGLVRGFTGDDVLVATRLPGASAVVGTRLLAAFAFMAVMHYLVWIVVVPALSADRTRRFEEHAPALTTRRLWAGGLALTALLAVVFLTGYARGYAAYSVLATYHAYLELPVLVAALCGTGAAAAPRPPERRRLP